MKTRLMSAPSGSWQLPALGPAKRADCSDPAGSADDRFRRALDLGNHLEALSAATELEHVGIVEGSSSSSC